MTETGPAKGRGETSAVATVSQDRIRSELERQGIQSDVAAALAGTAARRAAPRIDWLAPIAAAGLLALLGWIALSIHDMNARIGVVETRLIGLEEGQAAARKDRASISAEIKAGLADAKADRQVIDGKANDILRRLPPAG